MKQQIQYMYKLNLKGPKEYSNIQSETFPYIVIKIESTNKNINIRRIKIMGGHMELVKNNVYLRNKAGQAANKMYVNEEVNVSEVFPEIYNIVREKQKFNWIKLHPKLTGHIKWIHKLQYFVLYK